MQQTNRSRHRHITSFQVISLGFLSVILLGSLLLMLPIATKSGQSTSFSDALFTATSAVCVTGLVIKDTATYWSLFGQGVMSYGQYYLLTVVCGFIASMLAAVVSMLVAAKMHTISVAVCIPFFLYCLLPFIGRALSGYTTLFNLIPTILTNVQASVKVPLIYQIGNCVFRQIPLVMVMYTVMAIALLPFIYKSFRRYENK